MFRGRDEELQQLAEAMRADSGAILVYGKRRVGKTTLIREALLRQGKRYVYYECVRGTLRENIDGLTQELTRVGLLPFTTVFPSFGDVFAYLNTLPEPVIVVLDEYPYLKTMTPEETVDSMFQRVIDTQLRNVCLVISGSHMGMMKAMLAEGNALYGRFGLALRLRELSYREAAAFYPEKTPYEKIGFYAVFGGSPFVLQELDPAESLREAIIRTVLNERSPVSLYASRLLLSDYANTLNAERILAALGNGRKHYRELENELNARQTGNLAKQLKSLTALEIIRRSGPINRPDEPRRVTYETEDNLIRFYFTYVYRSQSALGMLGPEAFYDAYVAPTLSSFIARRYEEISRDYFSLQAKRGLLPGIRNIGTYYYDDPARRRNGEFDVALDYGDSVTIYEVKYTQKPLTLDEIHREMGQIREIRELNVAEIGFVSANGFAQREDGYRYVTGEDMYR